MLTLIIPTLNEEDHIGNLLSILFQKEYQWLEVIVVDGGSTDDTLPEVKQFNNVTLIEATRGRATQMNAGAKLAKNEYLLFFHADTFFEESFLDDLPQSMGSTEAGAFTTKFDENDFWLNFYAWCAKFNYSLFTYGDQGLLIKKSLFHKLGGFRDIPILEDLDLVRRIKRQTRFKKFENVIITSARRFKKHGSVKQQILNLAIVLGYYLGISPHFLARFYRY